MSVGIGVGTGVSVGGTGVAVGIAASVSAIMVNAAATAVPWMSSTLIVGSGSEPHALSMNVLNRSNTRIFFLLGFFKDAISSLAHNLLLE